MIPPRILPFVPLDREDINRRIDEEIIERERAAIMDEIADTELDELDLDRIISGKIEP